MMYSTNPTGCFNIPDQPLEPPDPVIIGYCYKCKCEIYQDEPTAFEDGRRMCVDCFRARVEEILKDSPAVVADCLGMRYEEGEID